MKRFTPLIFAALALALVAPLASLADNTAAPPPPPNPAMFQIMEQTHAQMDKLHGEARLAMLNSLSPAHRNMLAQVVGQLAIAPNPDSSVAARQIDSTLSAVEARSIVNISASLQQQARQLMESAHQQMLKAMPAGAPTTHGPWGMHGEGSSSGTKTGTRWSTDPGMILLMTTRSAGFEGFRHMPMGVPAP
jgi:hypothetical protein